MLVHGVMPMDYTSTVPLLANCIIQLKWVEAVRKSKETPIIWQLFTKNTMNCISICSNFLCAHF